MDTPAGVHFSTHLSGSIRLTLSGQSFAVTSMDLAWLYAHSSLGSHVAGLGNAAGIGTGITRSTTTTTTPTTGLDPSTLQAMTTIATQPYQMKPLDIEEGERRPLGSVLEADSERPFHPRAKTQQAFLSSMAQQSLRRRRLEVKIVRSRGHCTHGGGGYKHGAVTLQPCVSLPSLAYFSSSGVSPALLSTINNLSTDGLTSNV